MVLPSLIPGLFHDFITFISSTEPVTKIYILFQVYHLIKYHVNTLVLKVACWVSKVSCLSIHENNYKENMHIPEPKKFTSKITKVLLFYIKNKTKTKTK